MVVRRVVVEAARLPVLLPQVVATRRRARLGQQCLGLGVGLGGAQTAALPEMIGPVCSRRGLRRHVGVGVGVRRVALAGFGHEVREERGVAADLGIDEHVAQLAQVDLRMRGVGAVRERHRDPRAVLRLEALLQYAAQNVLPILVPRGHRREDIVDAVGVLPRHLQPQLALGAWLLPQHRVEQRLAWVRRVVTQGCARASARLRAER